MKPILTILSSDFAKYTQNSNHITIWIRHIFIHGDKIIILGITSRIVTSYHRNPSDILLSILEVLKHYRNPLFQNLLFLEFSGYDIKSGSCETGLNGHLYGRF